MSLESAIVLKPGKERPIKNRHHWVFSGATASQPSNTLAGEIVPVLSSSKELLGHAFFNPRVSIVGRMLSFGETPPQQALFQSLRSAVDLRLALFDPSVTNAYRLVNGEGDALPGLVVDKYADVLVFQISSLGMEKLKNTLLSFFMEHLKPRSIFEKSTQGSRLDEGLPPAVGTLFGPEVDEVEILENHLKFIVTPSSGQKTGFFLDQREMRRRIGELARHKKVLNGFSYSGGFSLYALAQGAAQVVSVDTSKPALEQLECNLQLNGLADTRHTSVSEDVFKVLQQKPLPFDLIILDPPAFAKRREDVRAASKKYFELNRVALENAPEGALLLTCSCSAHLPPDAFQEIVFKAARACHRSVRIVGRHHLSPDHPVNLFHPETDYLKGLLLAL